MRKRPLSAQRDYPQGMKRVRLWVVAFTFLAACSEGKAPDATAGDSGLDAMPADAGRDGADATSDGSFDAGDASSIDSGFDAGTVGSAGCRSGAGLPEGENTFTLDGLRRRFVLRLPGGYRGERPWPLVLALHGNGGSARYWDATSGSRNIRDVLRTEAVLVIAEAIDGKWRDYDMPRDTWSARIEQELSYFDYVLTLVRRELCLDETETFAMGFSGGGSFAGVLGCRRDDIRAFAAGGAVIYFDEADCIGHPAAWITIGTMELDGREPFRDFWRQRAGCEDTGSGVPPDPIQCTAYDGCAPSTPVHYCQHPGGHMWPDYGSQAMWSFFSQFVD